MRMFAVGLVSLGLAGAFGCGRPQGASTPEAAYEGARKAHDNRDWETYLTWYEPEIRTSFVGLAHAAASMASLKSPDLEAKLSEIETRHGIRSMSKSEPTDVAGDPLENVKDVPKLFGELVRYCEANGKTLPVFYLGDLTGLGVSGDVATGGTSDPRGKTWSVKIVRRGGKWFLSQ